MHFYFLSLQRKKKLGNNNNNNIKDPMEISLIRRVTVYVIRLFNYSKHILHNEAYMNQLKFHPIINL